MERLAVAALFALVQGLLYLYVGSRIARRRVGAGARTAHAAFLYWWFGLGAVTLLGALLDAAFLARGGLPFWLFEAATQVNLLLIVVALAGLMYFLLFLYRGDDRHHVAVALYYVAFWAALEALVFFVQFGTPLGPPTQVVAKGWSLATLPDQSGALDPIWGFVFLLFFLGPQLIGAGAYLLLIRKTNDPTVRFRIAVVAGTFLVWFGTAFAGAGAGTGATSTDGYQVFTRVLGLVATLAILTAYLPPRSWRKRWGLRGIDDEGDETGRPGTPAPPAGR